MSNEPLGIVAEAQRRRGVFARFIEGPARIFATPLPIEHKPEPPPPPPGPSQAEIELLAINGRLRNDNARLRQIITLSGRDAGPPPESDAPIEPTITIPDVMHAFCEAMTAAGERIESQPWTVDHLKAARRSRDLSKPRQVCMALVRHICIRASLPQIAKAFGRDHTTAMYACRRAPEILEVDPRLAAVHATVLTVFATK